MRLARLALDAALDVDGVLAADAGPRGLVVTRDGTALLRGVLVAAEAGRRYSVDLGLRVRLVPLPALAEAVRARVARNARLGGVGDLLGAVTVTVQDVVDDDELAAAGLVAMPAPVSPEVA